MTGTMVRRVRGASSTLYATADQVVVSGGNFLFTAALARVLTVEQFGTFALVWLIVLFANTFEMAAIVMPMFTLAGRYDGREQDTYLTAAFWFQAILNGLVAISGVVVLAFCAVLWPSQEGMVVFALAIIITYNTQEYFRRLFFCRGQPRRAICVDVIAYGVRLLPVFGMLGQGSWSPERAMALVVVCYALSSIVGFALNGRIRRPDAASWALHRRRQWDACKYLLPSGLLQWFSINFHLTVASAVLGLRTVGVIRVGQSIANVGNVYLQSMENTVPMRISRTTSAEGDFAGYREARAGMIRGGVAVAIVGAIVCCFARPLMSLVFGTQYEHEYYIIYWFVGIYLVSFLLVYARALLRALNATRYWLQVYVVSSGVSIVSFYPLQKSLGVTGVLLGMLVAALVVLVGSWAAIRRLVRV